MGDESSGPALGTAARHVLGYTSARVTRLELTAYRRNADAPSPADGWGLITEREPNYPDDMTNRIIGLYPEGSEFRCVITADPPTAEWWVRPPTA